MESVEDSEDIIARLLKELRDLEDSEEEEGMPDTQDLQEIFEGFMDDEVPAATAVAAKPEAKSAQKKEIRTQIMAGRLKMSPPKKGSGKKKKGLVQQTLSMATKPKNPSRYPPKPGG